MAIPRSAAPVTLSQIHSLVGGELHGDPGATITSLAGLQEATPSALCFIAGDKALKSPQNLRAGALLVHRRYPELAIPQIVVNHPLLAFAQGLLGFDKP